MEEKERNEGNFLVLSIWGQVPGNQKETALYLSRYDGYALAPYGAEARDKERHCCDSTIEHSGPLARNKLR